MYISICRDLGIEFSFWCHASPPVPHPRHIRWPSLPSGPSWGRWLWLKRDSTKKLGVSVQKMINIMTLWVHRCLDFEPYPHDTHLCFFTRSPIRHAWKQPFTKTGVPKSSMIIESCSIESLVLSFCYPRISQVGCPQKTGWSAFPQDYCTILYPFCCVAHSRPLQAATWRFRPRMYHLRIKGRSHAERSAPANNSCDEAALNENISEIRPLFDVSDRRLGMAFQPPKRIWWFKFTTKPTHLAMLPKLWSEFQASKGETSSCTFPPPSRPWADWIRNGVLREWWFFTVHGMVFFRQVAHVEMLLKKCPKHEKRSTTPLGGSSLMSWGCLMLSWE